MVYLFVTNIDKTNKQVWPSWAKPGFDWFSLDFFIFECLKIIVEGLELNDEKKRIV